MKLPYTPTEMMARSQVVSRTWPFFIDLCVGACGLAIFFAVVHLGSYYLGQAVPETNISLNVGQLPVYALFSVVRIALAYLLSLVFAVAYGYIAAYNPRVEAWMIAVLDILQSIPVLSFLPGVMLAMMALVPNHQLGIEMGAILLIFTGQVWNMAFSFYSSLKSIPREMMEASRIFRYSAWQRFWQLEMPYAAIGLIWNSIVSVAGGWFFLIACEMFPLGGRNFRLPGLGSYLQTAANTGNTHAMLWGLLTQTLIIVAADQLLWRPLIAWSDKFKFEQVESTTRATSPLLAVLRRSSLVSALTERAMNSKTLTGMEENFYRRLAHSRSTRVIRPLDERRATRSGFVITAGLSLVAAVLALWGASNALKMLHIIHRSELLHLLWSAFITFLRVNLSLLLAAAWTIPVGVAIGFNPKLSKIAQPIAQVIASIPATAFFPVLLLALMKVGLGLGIGSIGLMMLGTQWYILFNVIAGAMAIPTDLKEAASLYRFPRWQRWQTLILPGIFPYLLTGLVTASGGAWNASIIAEYYHLQDKTLHVTGLGAEISAASDAGRFPMLLVSTILMALMVVSVNRLVWRRFYRLAETRYKLEG